MINILLFHHDPEYAYDSLTLHHFNSIKEPIRIFIRHEQQYNELVFKHNNRYWPKTTPEEITKISFDLKLCHGSELHRLKINEHEDLILFGGSPEDYKVKYPDNKVINLKIFDKTPLSEKQWRELLNYAKTQQSPSFLYSPDLEREKKLQDAYRQYNAFDWSTVIPSDTKALLICNTFMNGTSTSREDGKLEILKTAKYDELLDRFRNEKLSPDILLIPAELDFEEQDVRLQALWGTRLIKDLRLMKIKIPVLLFSPLFSKHELKSRDPYRTLMVPGQDFFLLPGNKEELKKTIETMQPLKKRLLEEIIDYHYRKDGQFRELTHDLLTNLRNVPNERTIIVTHYFDRLRAFFRENYFKNEPEIAALQSEIQSKLHQNEHRFLTREIFVRELDGLEKMLLPEEHLNKPKTPEKLNWKILYLEDMASDRKYVCEAMDALKLGYVDTDSAEMALQHIRADKDKEFKVLIVDWRLKESDGETWQPLQGLDVIEQVSIEEKRELAFFILTDRQGGILDEIRRRQRIPIRWYTKEAVFHNEGIKYFLEHVLQEGNLLYTSSLNQPQGKAWYHTREQHLVAPLREYWVMLQSPKMHLWKKHIFNMAENMLLEIVENGKITSKEYRLAYTQRLLKKPDDIMADVDEHEKFLLRFLNKMIGRLIYFTLRKMGKTQQDVLDILGITAKKKSDFLWWLAINEHKSDGLFENMLTEEEDWMNQFLENYDIANDLPPKENQIILMKNRIRECFTAIKDLKLTEGSGQEAIRADDPVAQLQWMLHLRPSAMNTMIVGRPVKTMKDKLNRILATINNECLSNEEIALQQEVRQMMQ